MPLNQVPVGPIIPVSDLDTARTFYETKLGLRGAETPGGGARLTAGAGTVIYLLPVGAEAGSASWPLASFKVDDLPGTVDQLRERGVSFFTDDELPFDLDDRGISTQDGLAVAWMRDADGNILTVFSG